MHNIHCVIFLLCTFNINVILTEIDVHKKSQKLKEASNHFSPPASRNVGRVLSISKNQDGYELEGNTATMFSEAVIGSHSKSICQSDGERGTGIPINDKCLFPKYYNGNSTLPKDVCSKQFWPNRHLQCFSKNMTCQEMPEGGFACIEKPENFSISDKACDNQSLCPSGWMCFSSSRANKDYRCQPTLDSTRSITRVSTTSCTGNEHCKNGAACKWGRCVCLQHYEGEYCEWTVNYCSDDPCPRATFCEPRLGGFNCNCSSTLMGITCGYPKNHNVMTMVQPNIIYSPRQYLKFKYAYCFYAKSVGSPTLLTINFGDGRVLKADEKNFTYSYSTLNHVLNLFYPPLILPLNEGYLYIFNHSYKQQGYFKISMQATENGIEVFRSSYTVHVEVSKSCHFTLMLINCAQEPKDAFIFNPNDSIEIISEVTVTCTQSVFLYKWKLYNVTRNDTNLTPGNKFKLPDDIITTVSDLTIPKYTLPTGMYIARLHVTMTKPHRRLKDSKTTWFVVQREVPKLKIKGNFFMQFYIDKPIHLIASLTDDTLYETELINNSRFAWSCNVSQTYNSKAIMAEFTNNSTKLERVDFCPQNFSNITGSILEIPANVLKMDIVYSFLVSTNESSDRYLITLSTVRESLELVRIECVENCDSYVNPELITVFKARCIDGDISTLENYSFRWKVIASRRNENVINIMNTYYGLDSDILVINENVLNYSSAYIFNFEMKPKKTINLGTELLTSEDVVKAQEAKFTIDLTEPIQINDCRITPSQGFSIFDMFSIRCNVTTKNSLLKYSVTQCKNLTDISKDTHSVSIFTTPIMTNLVLGSGFADFDYLTTIHINVSSPLYPQSHYSFNVTVFPVTKKIKKPEEFFYMFYGEQSLLAKLNLLRNTYTFLQAIQCIVSETYKLLAHNSTSDSYKLRRNIFKMKETILDYLCIEHIHNAQELSHFVVTTTDLLLKLQTHLILPSTVYVVTQLFNKVLHTLTNIIPDSSMEKNLEELSNSIVEMGVTILTTAITSSKTKGEELDGGFYEAQQMAWVKRLSKRPLNEAPLSHLTRNVFEGIITYCHFRLNYYPKEYPLMVLKSRYPHILTAKLRMKVDTNQNDPTEIYSRNAAVVPFIPSSHLNKTLALTLLVLDENPFWGYKLLQNNIFPVINFNVFELTDTKEKIQVRVSGRVYVQPFKKLAMRQPFHAELKVVPFWVFSDNDIQIYCVELQQGMKLFLNFSSIKERIQVVIKKSSKPDLFDFWNKGVTLPRNKEIKEYKRYFTMSKEAADYDGQRFYFGIIPHFDTLKKLLNKKDSISGFLFPDMVSHEVDPYEEEFENVVAMAVKSRNNQVYNKSTSVDFHVGTISCHSLNHLSMEMSNKCHINESEIKMISCTCEEMGSIVFQIENSITLQRTFPDLNFLLTEQKYPVIVFILLYTASVFIVLFLWAWYADKQDQLERDVIFLGDNNPTDKYTYVLIVYTGRRPQSGTTSKVAIQLVGGDANSSVHILTGVHRKVLSRGSQEWFVLKTEKSLGAISWINLWHNYSGASPAWYCDKVVVQDIQTNHVWMFVVEQWLDPLHGDGTMSCSVDSTLGIEASERNFRFYEYLMDECDFGNHAWFSMFNKRTGGTFTRCQRVGVTLTYIAVIAAIISHMYVLPVVVTPLSQAGKKGTHEWDFRDVSYGVYAALIALPVYIGLYWLFRCIEPKSELETSPLYQSRSLVITMIEGPYQIPSGDDIHDGNNQRVCFDKEARKLPYIVMAGNTSSPTTTNMRVMHIERLEDDGLCLPHWFTYIAWLFLFTVISVCIYYCTLYSITPNDVLTICFLLSFSAAVLASIILESVKVAIVAFFNALCTKTKVISIEDRSDLVRFLDEAYEEKRRQLLSERLDELKIMREQPIYTPISNERVHLLRRIIIAETTARHIITDLCIFLLFLIILCSTVNGIRDSREYFQVRNIRNLMEIPRQHGKIKFHKVPQDHEGFITFVTNTAIPNIYKDFEYNGQQSESGLSTDSTNYLIGVPRLRQIRVSKKSCKTIPEPTKKEQKDWTSRCTGDYYWIEGDTHDYRSSWNRPVNGNFYLSTDIWKHHDIQELETPSARGNISFYPGSGYVALLARNREASILILRDLTKTKWYDGLTVALFLEFILYNANLKLISTVSLMGECTVTGGYNVASNIKTVKLNPNGSISKTATLALLGILIFAMICHMRGQSNRIVGLHPTRYESNGWFAIRLIVLALGVAVILLYWQCSVTVELSRQKLRNFQVQEFVNFYPLVERAEILIAVLGITIFLIILELWHIFAHYFMFHAILTTVNLASYALFCYIIIIAIFFFSFTWTGYLLFITSSFQFRNIANSIMTLTTCLRHFLTEPPINFTNNPDWLTIIVFYIIFFVLFMFIFKWGFAIILIHKYSKMMTFANNLWLEPALNKHMQIKLASRLFLGNIKMTREYILATLALLKQNLHRLPKARIQAMKQIVIQFKSQKNLKMIDETFLANARNFSMAALVLSKKEENKGRQLQTNLNHERREIVLVRTNLRLANLQSKVNKLQDIISHLVDNNEI